MGQYEEDKAKRTSFSNGIWVGILISVMVGGFIIGCVVAMSKIPPQKQEPLLEGSKVFIIGSPNITGRVIDSEVKWRERYYHIMLDNELGGVEPTIYVNSKYVNVQINKPTISDPTTKPSD